MHQVRYRQALTQHNCRHTELVTVEYDMHAVSVTIEELVQADMID